MNTEEFFAYLREHYEYDVLWRTWFAKGAVIRHEDGSESPARIPVPPFGIRDMDIANARS